MDAIHQGQQAEQPQAQETDSGRPEWMPEKFMKDGKPDYEALAKSYGELEKARGSAPEKKDGESSPVDPNAPDPKAADPNGEAAQKVVENAGLKFDEFTTEWADKGELSEASYEKLAKAGIPKELVDSYIAGQKSLADSKAAELNNAAYSAAGSEENYRSVIAWAAENLSAADKKAFNASVESGDPAQIKMAVEALAARAKSGGGVEPKNVQAQSPAGDSGYSSVDEMIADMQRPEYQTNESFRQKVARKVAASSNV